VISPDDSSADPLAIPRYPCAACQIGHDTLDEVWRCCGESDEQIALDLDDDPYQEVSA
jgi:hypothetical protein